MLSACRSCAGQPLPCQPHPALRNSLAIGTDGGQTSHVQHHRARRRHIDRLVLPPRPNIRWHCIGCRLELDGLAPLVQWQAKLSWPSLHVTRALYTRNTSASPLGASGIVSLDMQVSFRSPVSRLNSSCSLRSKSSSASHVSSSLLSTASSLTAAVWLQCCHLRGQLKQLSFPALRNTTLHPSQQSRALHAPPSRAHPKQRTCGA
jgi:hypothetical protein